MVMNITWKFEKSTYNTLASSNEKIYTHCGGILMRNP